MRAQAGTNTKTDIEYKGIPNRMRYSSFLYYASGFEHGGMLLCHTIEQLHNPFIASFQLDGFNLVKTRASRKLILIGVDKVQELRSSGYSYMSITEWYVTFKVLFRNNCTRKHMIYCK